MFLMIGISDGRKDFDFLQSILCRICGKLKTCSYCGYSTYEDFQFCPKCGRGFNYLRRTCMMSIRWATG